MGERTQLGAGAPFRAGQPRQPYSSRFIGGVHRGISACLMLGALVAVSACLAATARAQTQPTSDSIITINSTTSIVNISGTEDGAKSYNAGQTLWYQPFNTNGTLLELPVQAGTYSFRIVDPADAAALEPSLTAAQKSQIFTAWSYNTPWVTNYLVFDISAATDSTQPQILYGARTLPNSANTSAQHAYDEAVSRGYDVGIHTFAAATTLIFAVADYGLSDNAGGLSVLVTKLPSTPAESALHSFGGSTNSDGNQPETPLVADLSGNLYGTTEYGGSAGSSSFGTVFELANNSGSYTEKVLHTFTGAPDGANPFGGLLMDAAGNLYGTTYRGGANGDGIVFELVNNSGSYTEKVLYTFTGNPDGAEPYGTLIADASGDLFGTTLAGGLGDGTVFELANSGDSYTEKVLYSSTGFSNSDMVNPEAGLVMDLSGNLFGTTNQGGANTYYGTVFELVNSSGSYTEKLLYSFQGGSDGAYPYYGSLVMDGFGDLFGTTQGGGASGNGTVFEMVNNSGSYSEKVIYSFAGATNNDGSAPRGGLFLDSFGNIFGTTDSGGPGDAGTVFQLSNLSGTYSEKVLYNFTASPDGVSPEAAPVMGSFGNLFGTTAGGGANNLGSVFEFGAMPSSPAAVTFSPTSLDLGSEALGVTTAEKTVTVTDSGSGALTFGTGAVTISGANASDFALSTDNCSAQTVAVGSNCTAGVTFTPSAVGSETASLDFSDNATPGSQSVQLTGTGALPTVTVSPASLTFPATVVGVAATAQTVTLSNTGSVDLTINSISTNLSDYSQTNTCGTTVASGSSCQISVTFTPSNVGTIAGTLSIDDNTLGSPQMVTLTGTGQAPSVSVSPASLNFAGADIGSTSGAQAVTLSNNSSGALSITGISASGDFAQTNNCGSSLAANTSCAIQVTFTPTTAGSRSGTLTIADNASSSPQTVALTGEGEDFSLSALVSQRAEPPGVAAYFSLQAAPEGGFNGTVQFACSGAPERASCTVKPSSATLNGSSAADALLEVDTTFGTAAVPWTPNSPSLPPAALWFGLAALLAIGVLMALRRRLPARLRPLAPIAALLLGLALCASCNSATPGTPPGTYKLTVTATSGNLTKTTDVTLTVK